MEVVCIHGMGRTRYSMARLGRYLRSQGHRVHLFGYPRRSHLRDAAHRLRRFLEVRQLADGGPELGFVGHSAGGVLLRYLSEAMPGFRAGRSVALGSPIVGSILAERFSQHWWMSAACGPILGSLHPERVAELPLPPCDLAAVAGTAQTRFLPASVLLRRVAVGEPSDSTVLVQETRFDALEDWIEVDVIHTLLPLNARVHRLVAGYLERGHFDRELLR